MEPVFGRVEEQLVAAEGVFLPAGELVIDGQGDAFLELAVDAVGAGLGPVGEADDVVVALEAEGHVEVFRHVGFAPEFVVAVFVLVADALDCFPAEDGVVADEGGDVAVGDGVADGGVDEVGEEGDAILEEVELNLHHTGVELHDANFGRLLHLGDCIEEAIGWYSGVAVNEKNIVADPDVTIHPGIWICCRNRCNGLGVSCRFVVLGPFLMALDFSKSLFNFARKHEAIVHIGGL